MKKYYKIEENLYAEWRKKIWNESEFALGQKRLKEEMTPLTSLSSYVHVSWRMKAAIMNSHKNFPYSYLLVLNSLWYLYSGKIQCQAPHLNPHKLVCFKVCWGHKRTALFSQKKKSSCHVRVTSLNMGLLDQKMLDITYVYCSTVQYYQVSYELGYESCYSFKRTTLWREIHRPICILQVYFRDHFWQRYGKCAMLYSAHNRLCMHDKVFDAANNLIFIGRYWRLLNTQKTMEARKLNSASEILPLRTRRWILLHLQKISVIPFR